MTEYTTSSEAIREYMSARDRTRLWVQQHFQPPNDDHRRSYLSPSSPPSELDDSDAPSYGPSDSDAGSSHSLPPRMILRWNDGRPDIPIAPETIHPRAGPPPAQHAHPGPQTYVRERAGDGPRVHGPSPPRTAVRGSGGEPVYSRYEQTLSYVTAPGQEPPPLQVPASVEEHSHPSPPSSSPEHIVVLPSPQEEGPVPPQAPGHVSVGGTERGDARFPSRTPTVHPAHRPPQMEPSFDDEDEDDGVYVQQASPDQTHNIVSPSPRRAYNTPRNTYVSHNPSTSTQSHTRSPPIAHAHSQPLPDSSSTRFFPPGQAPGSARAQSQLPYAYTPPAIVYAPSSKHGSRYAPPAIVYSPPSHSHSHPHPHHRGPAPSITYSHSAPLPHGHDPRYAPAHAQGVPRHASHPGTTASSYRGVPSYFSAATLPEEEESGGYVDVRRREPSRRSASRGHRRDGSVGGAAEGGRGRTPVISVPRSPTRSESRSRTPSLSGAGSETSGSTYYILPTPGQKVQIIQPGGGPSVYTATSTTKSGQHSPHSASGQRKPFFQRIFSIPKFASSVDSRASTASRKLQRRPTVPPRTHSNTHTHNEHK